METILKKFPKMKLQHYILTLIFVLAIGFGGGYYLHPDNEIIIQTDTIYVEGEPQVVYQLGKIEYITKKEIQIDTLIVSKIDTIVFNIDTIQIAKADTSFKEGNLKVQYYFPPINYFKFNWQPNPIPVITMIQYLDYEPKWYERKEVWGLTGLSMGFIAGTLIK